MKEEKNKKNPLGLWLGMGLIFFGLFAVINGVISLSDNKGKLIAPNGIITIETVETPEARQKGLSGRTAISDKEGMMFVFDEPSESNCFWMKDMNFSIDMIWLDENKEVINLSREVSPDTYPESFCPTGPAKYGLEIGSGRAGVLEIEPGETLRF